MDENVCLFCGQGLAEFLHWCRAYVLVIDPTAALDHWRNTNPLDRLTSEDVIRIEGDNPDEVMRAGEELLAASEDAFMSGVLTHQVEVESITGTGFQGAFVCRAFKTKGHTEADLEEVLEFINNGRFFSGHLEQNEIYICRLVSMDEDGIRYVWSSKKLVFRDGWVALEW